MTEGVTINNEELAILCDIVSGWGVKKWAEDPAAVKAAAGSSNSSWIRRTSTRGFRHEISAHNQSRDSLCSAVRRNKRRVSCRYGGPHRNL